MLISEKHEPNDTLAPQDTSPEVTLISLKTLVPHRGEQVWLALVRSADTIRHPDDTEVARMCELARAPIKRRDAIRDQGLGVEAARLARTHNGAQKEKTPNFVGPCPGRARARKHTHTHTSIWCLVCQRPAGINAVRRQVRGARRMLPCRPIARAPLGRSPFCFMGALLVSPFRFSNSARQCRLVPEEARRLA